MPTATAIANDADCFALSEARDGAAAGAAVVFGVIIGTGVGGGVVVGGKTLSGPNAIVGEWGHNPLPWPQDDERPGPECYCGLRGCIETFLSGRESKSLVRLLKKLSRALAEELREHDAPEERRARNGGGSRSRSSAGS